MIATCVIPGIPLAWITQLAPGGAMLVNLRGEIAGGTLCLLSKDITGDNEVIGSFLDIAHDITNPHFRFLAQFYVRGIRILATTPQCPPYATIHAETTDGSWATAHTTTGHITQGGIRRLWDTICAAHTSWRDLNQPPVTRFGIVANPTTQFAYLDHDHNWTRWPLPLL